MFRHVEWEVGMHPPTQLFLPNQLLTDPQEKDLLVVPITQPMVDLLCAIFAALTI